eukprot:1629339-Prymnesium_polylepis.1
MSSTPAAKPRVSVRVEQHPVGSLAAQAGYTALNTGAKRIEAVTRRHTGVETHDDGRQAEDLAKGTAARVGRAFSTIVWLGAAGVRTTQASTRTYPTGFPAPRVHTCSCITPRPPCADRHA